METVRPEVLIPVHTENLEFFRRFERLCKVMYPKKGEPVRI